MANSRKYIKAYREFKSTCILTTLCDVCKKKDDCAVYRLVIDAKKVAWSAHHHSVFVDINECSQFKLVKGAERFRGYIR